jgi:hypothetical protein
LCDFHLAGVELVGQADFFLLHPFNLRLQLPLRFLQLRDSGLLFSPLFRLFLRGTAPFVGPGLFTEGDLSLQPQAFLPGCVEVAGEFGGMFGGVPLVGFVLLLLLLELGLEVEDCLLLLLMVVVLFYVCGGVMLLWWVCWWGRWWWWWLWQGL